MRLFPFLLLLPCLLAAQNVSCALSGTVQDPASAVIAGAQLTLIGLEHGFARSATTNCGGFLSFPDLPPAPFGLTVAANGFRDYRKQGIQLNSGEERNLGVIHLQIGDVAETVTVTAEVVAVNTATGEK